MTAAQIAWGEYVRLRVHDHNGVDPRATGRVTQVKTLEDGFGKRRWIVVGWYDEEGKPEKETEHNEQELERVAR